MTEGLMTKPMNVVRLQHVTHEVGIACLASMVATDLERRALRLDDEAADAVAVVAATRFLRDVRAQFPHIWATLTTAVSRFKCLEAAMDSADEQDANLFPEIVKGPVA